jgi:hypothetical protein
MTVRKSYSGKNKRGITIYRQLTPLGNPHKCPRGGRVAQLLDQGKRPFAVLREEERLAGMERIEANKKKGLIA